MAKSLRIGQIVKITPLYRFRTEPRGSFMYGRIIRTSQSESGSWSYLINTSISLNKGLCGIGLLWRQESDVHYVSQVELMKLSLESL